MKISNQLLAEISENTFTEEDLDLSDTYIDDSDAFRLANALKSNNDIKIINLSTNDITDIGLEALVTAFQNVEELDISTNRISPAATKILAKSRLKTLNISGNPIGDESLDALVENKTLLELDIQGCKLSSYGIQKLFTSNTLQKLEISFNQIDKESFKTLPSNTTLKTLILNQSMLSDECLELIAKNKGLKKVNLSTNYLGNRVKLLAQNNTIEELDLSHNRIGDEGIGFFANNKAVKWFELSGNQITDKGIEFLSKNNTLKYLNLCHNNLDDECTKYLSSMQSLEGLRLTMNHISNTGAKIIIDAFRDKFKRFNLRGILAYNDLLDFELLEKYVTNPKFKQKEPEALAEIQDTEPPATPKIVLQLRRKKISPQKAYPENILRQKPTKYKTSLNDSALTSKPPYINGESSPTLIFSPKLKKQKTSHLVEPGSNSLQKEKAYYHFNTALSIILNHSASDPYSKTQNSSNISLIKEKLDSLRLKKS